MIITNINYSDISGGAARAAYRLHLGLNLLGEDAYMLVVDKKSTDKNVFAIKKREFDNNSEEKIKEKFLSEIVQHRYIDKNRTNISNTLFTLPYPGLNINTIPLIQNSDIINFHWISYFLSIASLKSLFSLNKPFVWTLHDQKPFTAGCHYTAECEKYINENCLNCPQLEDDYFNIPNAVFMDKIDLFEKANLTIITPSKWLANCAKSSKLFKKFRVESIPNSIETDIFYPIDKKIAKRKLGIDDNSITILFGAENGNKKRKGFHLLLEAVKYCLTNDYFKKLSIEKKINILCFGDPSSDLNSLNID
ncbi:MAG TPA: glycosyl transferase family 1, partial [Spirochaetota bacterium]|nr:glycosyl transferase family 1 [Spirochaetota bacterium]